MKRGNLSIIIPTLNAAAELPRCLESLTPGLLDGVIREVMLVDGGSTDATLSMASTAGCRIVSSPAPGRGRQLRIGARNAAAEWMLFLHADTALDAGWTEHVATHMSTPDRAAAFTLAYNSESKGARWLEKRVARRVKSLALPYGDQGLLIHKSLYEAIGGYEDTPLMEDVDIIRRIGRERLDIFNAKAITSAVKYERDGWRKRAWRNAWLLLRYRLGASPEKLARLYD